MDYKDEEQPKKKFTREDFKKDVKEAVEEAGGRKKKKRHQKKVVKTEELFQKKGGPKKKKGYESWSVAELRKKLNDKKKHCWSSQDSLKAKFHGRALP